MKILKVTKNLQQRILSDKQIKNDINFIDVVYNQKMNNSESIDCYCHVIIINIDDVIPVSHVSENR